MYLLYKQRNCIINVSFKNNIENKKNSQLKNNISKIIFVYLFW